jgi:molybdopterin converting factor small subunit
MTDHDELPDTAEPIPSPFKRIVELEAEVEALRAALATQPQPLWIALVEDVWRDDDDRIVARLRRTDDGNGTLPTGRSVAVFPAIAGSAIPTTEMADEVTFRDGRYYCGHCGVLADNCTCGAMGALAAADDATWD